MHCKTCDYPLWNLTTLNCPECGESYRPSEYEFVPNSVQFCCPHCQQSYFGTNENGHLEPAEFNCVNCSNLIHMDQMVLLPASGIKENWTKPEINPWLERKSMGLFKAWIASVSSCLVRPTSMMKSLGDTTRLGDAWKFAIFNLAIIVTAGIGLPAGVILFFQLIGRPSSSGIGFVGTIVFGIAIYALVFILGLLFWAVVVHGILRLTKSAKHTFGKTIEAMLYSSGVMAITAIPLIGPYCGNYVTLIWWIVCSIIMVSVGQKVSGGRATLAVITFPIIVFVLLGGMYALMIYTMTQSFSSFSTMQMQGVSTNSTYEFANDISTFTQDSNGVMPAHSILLLENPDDTKPVAVGRWITSEDYFVGDDTLTYISDIPVGDITLEDFQNASKTQRQDAVKNVLDSMPDNVIAHRLGDYIFTYHGIDLATADPKLWLVVYLPDQDVNNVINPTDMIDVGRVDGSTNSFAFYVLDLHILTQNELRRKAGLPPLPSLITVTHSSPAIAKPLEDSD